jgi:hypothetical protein
MQQRHRAGLCRNRAARSWLAGLAGLPEVTMASAALVDAESAPIAPAAFSWLYIGHRAHAAPTGANRLGVLDECSGINAATPVHTVPLLGDCGSRTSHFLGGSILDANTIICAGPG